jgi:2-keto-4-pentenoate hydratase/2-oxohepta-3-ene-1,7-dioic acid hydratase in catechol pathway
LKILCIHRRKGDFPDCESESPVFFVKPETALLRAGQPLYHPDFTGDLRCSVEPVLRIGRTGRGILPRFASRYIEALSFGLNFTACDLLEDCRKREVPEAVACCFDYSSFVAPEFIPFAEVTEPYSLNYSLDLNGTTTIEENISEMPFSFATAVARISSFVTLKMGDLIFLGSSKPPVQVNIDDTIVVRWLYGSYTVAVR